MSFTRGTRIGSYDVIGAIGAGGMGEVYRARDTRLNRDVALKILPEAFAADPERLARFEREAQVLASLNHPHIAAIHGIEESDGVRALVLEFVDGETLADRIARGPIAIDDALPIAKQIAEALEAAHEQGIIHRDLKPANIKVRSDGTVKVLDFGLAKLTQPAGVAPTNAVSISPTITSPALVTGVGTLLGTAAYMSPEQAKGREADKRSDIWAFGCVLFEMLTAKRAFGGEDVTDTIAAVVRGEPEWASLPGDLPDSIALLLKQCLQKDRRQRIADIAAASFVLQNAALLGAGRSDRQSNASRRRQIIGLAALAVAVIAIAAAAIAWMRTTPADVSHPVTRFVIALSSSDQFTAVDRQFVTISRDGTRIVYVANNRLYARALNELDAVAIRGTDGGPTNASSPASPFFSPDGSWVGFWQNGQLKKVAVDGGMPVVLCQSNRLNGAHWTTAGTIVFSQGQEGLWRVSANGGAPEQIVKVNAGQGAMLPQVLPDGKNVLFTFRRDVGDSSSDQIVVQSIDTGDRHVLIGGGSAGRYLPTGHVVYLPVGVRASGNSPITAYGSVFAASVDLASYSVVSGPVMLVQGVRRSTTGAAAQVSVSDTGTLAYVPTPSDEKRTLVWVDRSGKEERLEAEPRAYGYPRISPDGTRAAVADANNGVFVWDFGRKTLTKLTFAGATVSPAWSPDGKRIAFSQAGDIAWQLADGSGSVETLVGSPTNVRDSFASMPSLPDAFTRDGKWLLFRNVDPKNRWDVSILALDGDRARRPLVSTPFNERLADVSPDGRWIAYQSDESGGDEVFVRPFPDVNQGKRQISSGGGTAPLWASSGRELFYMAPGGRLMSVQVETQPTFSSSSPTKLIEGSYAVPSDARHFDVAPDGKHLLLLKQESGAGDVPRLVIVENWFAELRQRVPTNRR